ncbi:MAG: helix-turn-helix transcriptional regulator [Alicyclobacillaceae bacterium]|nr:helix-turn-helix transcriptional regulator [Alicyclobacillaceae bacterium]
MNHLAGRVRHYRSAQKLTVRELARRAGVSVSYIYAIEAGVRGHNIVKLERVAAALGVPLSALWDGSDAASQGESGVWRKPSGSPDGEPGDPGGGDGRPPGNPGESV